MDMDSVDREIEDAQPRVCECLKLVAQLFANAGLGISRKARGV